MTLNLVTILISFIILSVTTIGVLKSKEIGEAVKPFINYLRGVWGKQTSKHVKKQSKLDHDVIIGPLKKISVRNLVVGVKVLTKEGIANVKALREHNWVVVSYTSGRTAEHKVTRLFQYFVEVKDRRNDTVHLYPLAYSDYEFIHPDDVTNETWFEGFKTKKQYFKLLDKTKEDRLHLPIFNKSPNGQAILRQLEENGNPLEIKQGKLLIKSK